MSSSPGWFTTLSIYVAFPCSTPLAIHHNAWSYHMAQPIGLLLPNKESISNFDNHTWLTLGSTIDRMGQQRRSRRLWRRTYEEAYEYRPHEAATVLPQLRHSINCLRMVDEWLAGRPSSFTEPMINTSVITLPSRSIKYLTRTEPSQYRARQRKKPCCWRRIKPPCDRWPFISIHAYDEMPWWCPNLERWPIWIPG